MIRRWLALVAVVVLGCKSDHPVHYPHISYGPHIETHNGVAWVVDSYKSETAAGPIPLSKVEYFKKTYSEERGYEIIEVTHHDSFWGDDGFYLPYHYEKDRDVDFEALMRSVSAERS